jgi:excisionase family DNA binding protein
MTPRLDAALRELAAALLDEVVATRAVAPDRLLSVGEAAAALGLGRTAAYAEIAAGRLRSVKVGRRRLVAASAVDDYIKAASR